jgi:RAC serine/threonine-protein kinase
MSQGGIVHITVEKASKIVSPGQKVMLVVMLDNKQAVKSDPVEVTGDTAVFKKEYAFDVAGQAAEKGEVNIAIWSLDGEVFLGQVVIPVPYIPRDDQPAKPINLTKRKWRLADKVQGDLEIKMKYTETRGKIGVNDFAVIKVLGRGGFGKVLQVKKKDSGRIYAMKAIRKEHVLARNEIEHTLAEKDVMSKINHPFIVSLKYSFQTEDRLYLVMDFMNGGELFFHLQRDEKFPEKRAQFYAAEICLALEYIHSLNIIYRDLKPENILLDAYGHVCMTDFGLCKQSIGVSENTSTFCGSLAYMAPDVIDPDEKTGGYGRSVDWWSYGILLYEMIGGLPPFYHSDQMEMAQMIRAKNLEFSSDFSPAAQDLLRKLLDRNPVKRLANAPEIKAHAFFNGIDWDALYGRRVDAPFKPLLKGDTDVAYFDQEFTEESPIESYIDSRLSESVQANFTGFSFINPSEIKK